MQLLGDPELSIYTDEPVTMNVTHNPTVAVGNSDFLVNISNFPVGEIMKICLYKEGEVFAVAESGFGGISQLNITPNTPGQMKITVTCHNAEPYESTITVMQNPGVHLYAIDVAINDDEVAPSFGNDDGLLGPGETAELFVTLKNGGMANATDIDAEITYIDPEQYGYITVTQAESEISTLNSGQSGVLLPPFVIDVSDQTPDPYYATFQVTITAITNSQMNTYEDEFYLIVNAPELQIQSASFITSINPVNSIGPDDIVEVTFNIYNGGSGVSTGTVGTITESSNFIDVISCPNQIFGDIAPLSSVSNQVPFEFHVVNSYNNETIELTLTLVDEFDNELEIPVDFDLPDAVTNIKWKGFTDYIEINWTPKVSEKGYNIYRSEALEGTYNKINSKLIEGFSGYTDIDLVSNTRYFHKISCVSQSGFEGDFCDAVETWTSLPYHADWPNVDINVDDFGGRTEGSPMTADFDADGNKEIYFTMSSGPGDNYNKGGIFAFYHDGEEIYDIDENPTSYSGFHQFDEAGSSSTPVIGDLDNDNVFEIVTTTHYSNGADKRKMFIHSTVEDPLNPDYPELLWSSGLGGPEVKGAVLSDIDNNGSLEILVKARWGTPLYVLNGSDYSNYPGTWPVDINAQGFSMPVAADIDNNGDKEIIIGYMTSDYCDAGIYVYKSNGDPYVSGSNGLFYQNGPSSGVYDRMDSPVSVADINEDGYNEIICVSGRNEPGNPQGRVFILNVLNSPIEPITGWGYDDHIFNLTDTEAGRIWLPLTSVADVNGNEHLEVLIASDEKIYIWEKDGSELIDPIYEPGLEAKFIAPLIADVDEDDEMEIVVASNSENGAVYCFDNNGERVLGWPLRLPGISSTPCIDDIDNDGKNEIIATTGVEVHVWDTEGDADKVEWGKYRHDRYNSGVYGDFCPKSSIAMVISSIEDWTEPKILQSDLIIEGQAKLTIYNNLAMPEGSKIIIKQGGILVLDGAKITNACTGMWRGIEVWGDSSLAQIPDINGNYPQGFLELKNGAVIENAISAVLLMKYADNTTTGGIIKATDAVFRNNTLAIYACNYQNINPYNPAQEFDYYARFKDCTFEITSDYHGEGLFTKHVFLSNVKGIEFDACDFIMDDSAPGISGGNTAILSDNAGFRVSAHCNSQIIPCNDYDVCTFTGFKNAISAFGNMQNNYTFIVANAEFNNNACGVFVYAVNNFSVINSDFNIGYNSADQAACGGIGMLASGFGINANNSTGFAIEENHFYKSTGAPTGTYTGIRINETQDIDQVYRNSFDGLSYGNYTEGKNWLNRDTYQGLAFYCNQNDNNDADFVVEKAYTLQIAGIQSKQGDFNYAAGNTFSPSATWHYYNNGNHLLDYYYCNSCPIEEDPGRSKLEYVIDHGISSQNACLSHYGGGSNGGDVRGLVLSPDEKLETEQLYAEALSAYSNVKTLYDGLADGGNTEALVSEVETAWPADMWELREELLGKSPHLSKEVLMATADKTDVLPNAVIFEILAANPDELKKEDLLSYLQDKANPLPEYMVDILKELAAGTTYKTVLEQQMANHGQIKTRAAHDMIRSYLNDTVTNPTQLRNWLDNLGGKKADEQIITTYLQEKNYVNALALVAIMPQLYGYDAQEQSEHAFYTQMLNMQILLQQEGRYLFELDSTEVANLVNIAQNSHSTPGSMAKGILEAYYDYQYCDCLSAPDAQNLKSSSINLPSVLSEMFGGKIEATPNPAKDYTVFNFALPNGDTDGFIKVSDVNGNTIKTFNISGGQGQKVWDTRNLQPGVYFYTLTVNSFTKSGKLIINK